jgi:hypothetical protein
MARAYITLARNDLDANLLQVLDLSPNSSQRVPSLTPEGQTGYVTYLPQHDTIVAGGTTAYYGLAAYLWDTIEDVTNGNKHMTVADCNAVAAGILAAQGLGTALTTTTINALILAATGGADGFGIGASIGSIEDVMKICSGEVYYLPGGAIGADAEAWGAAPHYAEGRFLEANAVGSIFCASAAVDDYVVIGGVRLTAKATADFANQQFAQSTADVGDANSLCDLINDHRTQTLIKTRNNGVTVTATVVSNKVTLHASVPGTAGELTLTTSAATKLVVLAPDWVSGAYRPFRKIVDVGALHASALNGALSKLNAPTFAWINPAFTYGSAGTAFKVNGTTHIAATGVGAAVTVYDASGNVI